MSEEETTMDAYYDLRLINGGRIRLLCETDAIDDVWEEMMNAFANQGLWHVGSFVDRNGSAMEATFNGESMDTIDMAKVMGYS